MTTEALEAVDPDSFERDERTGIGNAIATIRENAARIEQRELDETIRKLDARGDLTDDQRATVEAMADAIIGRLLVEPMAGLRKPDDSATIDATLRLFDPASSEGPHTDGCGREVNDDD